MYATKLPVLDDVDVLPQVTTRALGIGIVGAGAIVRAGHLPAYRQAGFHVVAITDADRAKAEAVASEFAIATVHADAATLVTDPNVDVVDIAITPTGQAEVVRAATEAGKHVLAQKPFHTDLSEAARLVRSARQAGIQIAVNQQMRWDQVIRCNKVLADCGFFGTLTGASFDVHVMTDWSMWPWMMAEERLEYFYHSVHYIDAIRYLFGEPRSVISRVARYPGQAALGESRSFTLYEFEEDVVVSVLVDHNNWSRYPRAVVRCAGTEGQSEGTLGALYDYPTGAPDTFAYWSRSIDPATSVQRTFTQRWIPDAFVGPMADLQDAIAGGRAPLTSAEDNLRTLQVVQAAYRSAEAGRRVQTSEIDISAAL